MNKTETCCPECGFDMGRGFVNCGMSEDGTCPECHTVKPEQIHRNYRIYNRYTYDQLVEIIRNFTVACTQGDKDACYDLGNKHYPVFKEDDDDSSM